MGCAESKNSDVFDYLRNRFPRTLSILELQGYSKSLAESFIKHDKHGNQHLTLSEFLSMCKLSRNRVSERLFSLCDMDGNSTLDFREMCFAIWHLCTLDHRGLILMLFDIYDEFQNNMIEEEDMERLLGDAYGIESLRRPEILDLLDEVRLRRHLDRFQFEEFVTRAPQVLKQIIDVQRSMRQRILGEKVWEKLTLRRSSKTDPVFRPENWPQLMERIIMMDMDARATRAKELKEQNPNSNAPEQNSTLVNRLTLLYEP